MARDVNPPIAHGVEASESFHSIDPRSDNPDLLLHAEGAGGGAEGAARRARKLAWKQIADKGATFRFELSDALGRFEELFDAEMREGLLAQRLRSAGLRDEYLGNLARLKRESAVLGAGGLNKCTEVVDAAGEGFVDVAEGGVLWNGFGWLFAS